MTVHNVRSELAKRPVENPAGVGPSKVGGMKPRTPNARLGGVVLDRVRPGRDIGDHALGLDAERHHAHDVAGRSKPIRERRRVLLGAAQYFGGPEIRDHEHPHRRPYATGPRSDRRPPIHERDPFRVGILADTVDLPGGIGRYVREVLGAIGQRADVALTVLTPKSGAPAVRELAGDSLVTLITPPRSDQISLGLWDRYRAGAAFERADVEVVIGTKHLVPRTRRPTLLVVHDLLTITRARENALPKRILLPAQYRHSLTDASALVAVSAATRSRLEDMDTDWAAKCTVIPNGMSHRLLAAEAIAPSGIGDRPFALVVGDLSPRKNVRLLTRIWRAAPPAGLTLVLVGPDSGTDTPVRSELIELERAGRVVWIRGTGDEQLRWCYEHARVVLFPTFEEGFGLPLLEATTFHAPVVAGTDAALREVGGTAAGVRYIDPHDEAGWRAAISDGAHVSERTTRAPTLPAGAITWEQHTDRLVAAARDLARGTPSPRTRA